MSWHEIKKTNVLKKDLDISIISDTEKNFLDSLDKSDEEIKYKIAYNLALKNQIDKVIKLYNRAENNEIYKDMPLSLIAKQLLLFGYEKEAYKLFKADLKNKILKHWAKHLLGILEAKNANWIDAENLITEAITEVISEFKHENTWYGNLLILSLIKNSSMEFIQYLLSKAPKFGKYQLLYFEALQLARSGETRNSITLVKKVYSKLDLQGGMLDLIAWYMLLNKKYEQAIEFSTTERTLKKELPNTFINYAMTLAIGNNIKEAKKIIASQNIDENKEIRIGNIFFNPFRTSISVIDEKLNNKEELFEIVLKTKY
jgi:tetratricopeptide (TPR) repeat protein